MNETKKGSMVEVIGVYPISNKKNIYLVELIVHLPPSLVDLNGFLQKDNNLDKSDWQAPFNEHYLAEDGESIIGDFFSLKSLSCRVTRVVFSMFLESLGNPLSTPYGDIPLSPVKELPSRLSVIQYMQMD